MRLLTIGEFNDGFSAATKIALAKGAAVRNAANIDIALENLRSGSGADLILIDVRLDIKSLIDSLNEEHIFVPVVACGFNNNTTLAVNAIKAGAKEYIPLPPDEELIVALLESITSEENNFLYKSRKMAAIIALADQIAVSDASILITGESGTGKEVMARYIHNKSNRKNQVFISVNCAAIPENLIESELFGHEKGAFTGAISKRIGKFEEANNGTLLLDEISEIDIKLQAKLLRAIQEREIYRIGGNKEIKLNIRILATSNRDLKKEVEVGNFREDLYFRLNVINLKLPPLRERKEDLQILTKYFIEKYSLANKIAVKELAKSAEELVNKYDWQGNIRELENTIYRAVLVSKGDYIEASDLMLEEYEDSNSEEEINDVIVGSSVLVARRIEDVEKELILNTLNHCLGNRTHAANMLGISLRTLRNKLHSYNIQ